jgi:hypothetical protein
MPNTIDYRINNIINNYNYFITNANTNQMLIKLFNINQ